MNDGYMYNVGKSFMPEMYSTIRFRQGTRFEFNSLETKNPNCIYFLTDTHQIYVGDTEYTKSIVAISTRPKEDTPGDEGRIYLCTQDGSSYAYIGERWIIIYDPTAETVKRIDTGEGLTGGPITYNGTISHAVPEGAQVHEPDLAPMEPNFGDSVTLHEIRTDKFGHVTGILDRILKIPGIDKLSTVLRFKGTLEKIADLPKEGNQVGDVYYIIEASSEWVYLENGWEELGPVLDMSGFIPVVPGQKDYVTMFTEDGKLTSAGYKNISGATPGRYGYNPEAFWASQSMKVPELTVDQYGRVTDITEKELDYGVVDDQVAVDTVAWIMEQYLIRG